MQPLKTAIKALIVISLCITSISFLWLERLPDSEDITPPLQADPTQTPAEHEPIILAEDGYVATLSVRHEYDVAGLVVEEYTADNWLDVTHKNDPFNTRDFCLVWGENTKNNLYQTIGFSHGEFTCFAQFGNRDTYAAFQRHQFSNNHVIPANDAVAAIIDAMAIGDQIRLRGFLVDVNATIPDGRTWNRNTSVSRTDSGNGACELIYVTSAEIIASHNSGPRLAFKTSLAALLISAITYVWLFFYAIYEQQKAVFGKKKTPR